MSILFQTKAELTQASMQSHLTYTFYVPKGSEILTIDFDYRPDILANETKQKTIIAEALTCYNLLPNNNDIGGLIDKYSPLKNLLTLSIDDPNGFRGARHCHEPEQHIFITTEEASPGILSGKLSAGLWSVTISAHAIVTDKCYFSLIVKTDKERTDNILQIPWHYPMQISNIPENSLRESVMTVSGKDTAYEWIAAELHAHTFHSDGKQTVPEMIQVAEQQGLDVLAITDHNTTSPLREMEEQRNHTSLQLLYGLEWTTFFGHILTFGYPTLTYTDWRNIGPTDVHKGLEHIHRRGAVAGIAHPFRIGNPIGTGCHWEFTIKDINDFDFIEVWNGNHPSVSYYNHRAIEFWTELLNKGYRLPATAGRDWHHNDDQHSKYAITYVHMPQDSGRFRQDFLQSIREGRISISYYSVLSLEIEQSQQTYTIGDTVVKEESEVFCHLTMKGVPDHAEYKLISNLGVIMEDIFKENVKVSLNSNLLTWIRAEMYNQQQELIAFTNPIYFQ
ncbi:CehA/McbA family metallohydrolase [Amphibacillus sediminis]|uniref:CehA/McbA family metallohydrolase n=1 Tax=Amphibacillus sediminis TaxID=360185 RepID=UPI000831BF6C|nr:CehA/McbA family metallohydrolase [Amphibacillus sediminis]